MHHHSPYFCPINRVRRSLMRWEEFQVLHFHRARVGIDEVERTAPECVITTRRGAWRSFTVYLSTEKTSCSFLVV
jgi:hypothetical protein